MKRTYYFLKNYKIDLITAIFAILLLFVAHFFRHSFTISVIVVTLSILLIVYARSQDREFYFLPLTRRNDKRNWIGDGKFEYYEAYKCFIITDSESGFIYSKSLVWNNYDYEFDFKIINKCLGVIVRAVNLSNYVMLQINAGGIRPHIRINGGWKSWEAHETNFSFTSDLSLDEWKKCLISCEDNRIRIRILSNRLTIFDRVWEIPRGSLEFHFKRDPNDENPVKIPFPIDLRYGSVGFRDDGNERALVKNVLIKRI
jgi:hypothetical protein